MSDDFSITPASDPRNATPPVPAGDISYRDTTVTMTQSLIGIHRDAIKHTDGTYAPSIYTHTLSTYARDIARAGLTCFGHPDKVRELHDSILDDGAYTIWTNNATGRAGYGLHPAADMFHTWITQYTAHHDNRYLPGYNTVVVVGPRIIQQFYDICGAMLNNPLNAELIMSTSPSTPALDTNSVEYTQSLRDGLRSMEYALLHAQQKPGFRQSIFVYCATKENAPLAHTSSDIEA